ncbi:MAG: hypothetical protein ACOX2N_01825 [Peptococcia bacterium]
MTLINVMFRVDLSVGYLANITVSEGNYLLLLSYEHSWYNVYVDNSVDTIDVTAFAENDNQACYGIGFYKWYP